MPSSYKAQHISKCLELAVLFEVCAEKPGNVNLSASFEGTHYAHFLASAVATAPHFERAANQGIAISQRKINTSEADLGHAIKDCVGDISVWQQGGNTLLGTVILLMPLAVAAGMTPSKKAGYFEIPKLRENIKLIVESTTADDAVQFYEAIRIANPGGLNKAPDLDVNDPDSVNKIVAENISLYQVFRIAADYDNVCSEWVKNYPITFDLAYPHLKAQIIKTKNLNMAIVHTFLKVLSEYPDTFIARKVGFEKARAVSSEARKILNQGEMETLQGKESIRRFDNELRKSGNLLNPGTTADIIAAALALNILDGYKP